MISVGKNVAIHVFNPIQPNSTRIKTEDPAQQPIQRVELVPEPYSSS